MNEFDIEFINYLDKLINKYNYDVSIGVSQPTRLPSGAPNLLTNRILLDASAKRDIVLHIKNIYITMLKRGGIE